jgi:OPT family small oligopeptide transporter
LGGICWYFFPGYLFQALSYFTWVCWIAPDNVVVNQLFGYQSGLGMSLITFDWAQITYTISPLASPWWAEANVIAGFIMFFWIIAPIIYYTNTWYAKYMPMQSRTSFDNTGASYDVSKILTSDNQLNITAYEEYSPLFLSTTFAISYGLSFASITSTIMHAFLFFRKQIWTQARRSMNEQPDIHARLMSKYRQVPEWWYMSIFVVMFIFGIICIEVWPTDFPVWGFVLALIIAFLYIIPIGMIQAITNQQIGLNVITELIVGYVIPGRPLAMMMFKTWGYITMYQALQFASDFKLGHYMKVPPRTMFWGQVAASVVSGTVQLGVQAWMFTNIEDICTPHQKDGFICPSTQVFGTASIIVSCRRGTSTAWLTPNLFFQWGVIGPQRQFSAGQVYHSLTWFFLIGTICPVVAWLLQMKWPNSWVRYIK